MTHQNHSVKDNKIYFIPKPSAYPLLASCALGIMMCSLAQWLHGDCDAPVWAGAGLIALLSVVYLWFKKVVQESLHYNQQVDRSFRLGMYWFIFTEVMFFFCFFGALFYIRVWTIPWIAGDKGFLANKIILWPDFQAHWPLLQNPDHRVGARAVMDAWGLPAMNTCILLLSGVTLTISHHALVHGKKYAMTFLASTWMLGLIFLTCQAYEYHHAYQALNLTLASGIYGTIFFILTGFHGLHVTLGTLMLIVTWVRGCLGHLTSDRHFVFEATAWYWHFVDIVWLFLFVFIY